MNPLKNRSLVSINDYSKEEYLKILDLAEEFQEEVTFEFNLLAQE